VSLFFGRSEKRAVVSSDLWSDFAGRTSPLGGSLESQALSMVPVFAATRLLADAVASLPLQAYRKVGGARQPADLPALFQHPSRVGTLYDWVFRAMTSLTLRGNAYGLVTQYDALGYPLQIEWMHPDVVELEADDIFARPRWFVRGREVNADSMIHVPNYVLPGRVLGLSPIGAYRTVIETGLHAQRYGRDWFLNSSTPAGVIKTKEPLNQDQAAAVKAKFKVAAENRDIVTLPNAMEYEQISVPSEESQFLMTLRATASQVAAIYGVMPEDIGGETGSSLTYSTVEMGDIKFLGRGVRPYLTRLESAFFPLMPRPRYVRFNADAMIRTDTKTRYETYQIARNIGLKSIDELRATEDMPPLPNGAGADYTPLAAKPATANGGNP
jgi:HK97 family phage portal protein